MNKLEIKNIDVKYPNESKYILKDFSLTVEENELLVILGNSGCGKSTLLKAISGLINPENGDIEYNNKSCFSKKRKCNIPVEERNFGYCFQNYALCPHMNVYDNLAMPLKARKMKKPHVRRKVREMLEFIDLHSLEKKLPNNLSGGEKQRVALGRAIIYDPSLLLLDEPLANLDANLKGELAKGIRKTHDELGITTIYVTHDQIEAFALADRIAVMQDGKIEQIDTIENIYQKPANLFVAKFIGKNNVLNVDEEIKSRYKESQDYRYFVFRPESVKIVKDSKLKARVKELSYLGSRYEIILDYLGNDILMYSDSNDFLKVNQEVFFEVSKYMLFND